MGKVFYFIGIAFILLSLAGTISYWPKVELKQHDSYQDMLDSAESRQLSDLEFFRRQREHTQQAKQEAFFHEAAIRQVLFMGGVVLFAGFALIGLGRLIQLRERPNSIKTS